MPRMRTAIIWIVLVFGFFFLFNAATKSRAQSVSWDGFLTLVESGSVKEVHIQGQEIRFAVENRNLPQETAIPPGDIEYLKLLRAKGVRTFVHPASSDGGFLSLLMILIVPVGIMFLFLFLMRRQMQGGLGGMMKLGSKKVNEKDIPKVTFKDVAGMEEVKQELAETVDYLKQPGKLEKLGGKVPKGVLLAGAPGTGKTLLAKAVAGEAGVAFFTASGSEFVEMFVGLGASRVRELFEQARKESPCIIFIDEVDSVGHQRGTGIGQTHNEHEQTLNQLLTELDGFKSREAVVVIAATNRPDMLDPALLRPGRFDRRIFVPMPDVRAREAILHVHAKPVKCGTDVDFTVVARLTPGMTGADIENLVNEAALGAARAGKDSVEQIDFIEARDKIYLGPAIKGRAINADDLKVVAYHEAGHTLVQALTLDADPLLKVTIVPHGMALGVTMGLPERDRLIESKERLLARLDVCFGGRLAEELVIGSISTGASNDFEQATDLARRMVTEWGMSKLGERAFEKSSSLTFLGRDFGSDRNYSEETAKEIDNEIASLLRDSRLRAEKLLKENLGKLDALAAALLERETLDNKEIAEILNTDNS